MQPRGQLLSRSLDASHMAFRAAHPAQRSYATEVTPTPAVKNPLQRQKGGDLGSHLPKHIIPRDAYIPAYPYGDHPLFKQANRGLYGDQMIQFGNNVSRKTETKTRRYWKPNVLSKSLYSVALKKKIKLRITSKVLKTMDREGGLDEYLLKDNEHRLKELGPLGWALRWTLLQKPEVVDRMRTQAAALGLHQSTIDAQWPTRRMLPDQKLSQDSLVRAADLIGDEHGEIAEEQHLDAKEDLAESATPDEYTRLEQRVRREAILEYAKAVKAAQRYLTRGLVDSEEEGLKLAFVRAKERDEAATALKQKYAKKLDQMFTIQKVQDTRTKFDLPSTFSDNAVRTIAYNQWRRRQIEEAGSYEAWKESVRAERTQGSPPRDDASRKAEYARLIEEAESASTNEALDAVRKRYLETAISKADRAIRAKALGGPDDYIELTLDDLRSTRAPRQASEVGGDAWAALVNSSNAAAENRPTA
ncbi:50S ribosomal protein-like protein L24 [Setomelanomma holmii]|uniref:Large ribosomal subunit protein bL28m n=1 Tax=Setomelanomma holmii TaxID=210430 RepID=A0A9P4GYQ0_9PLEO|nr:50S ribosomal protein-like protein L24 [Setomelanomma holmii]